MGLKKAMMAGSENFIGRNGQQVVAEQSCHFDCKS
jgi:hypothetical protein